MKHFNIKIAGLALLVVFGMTSCSDAFLEEKVNYDDFSSEIYNYYSGAEGRLSNLYQACNPNIQASRLYQFPSYAYADAHSRATEEYYEFSPFVDPQKDLDTSGGTGQGEDYFSNAWSRIRNVNECINGITNSTGLTETEKNELLGQAIFLRAWCYYYLVRYYGGVPIITTVQEPVPESVTPRSSAKECIEFICKDLQDAADMLYKRTVESSWGVGDYGRITTAAALALKGRVLNLWASPLFNRANDITRWEAAYEFHKEAKAIIEASGYGLAYQSNPGVNGQGWNQAFLDGATNIEGLYVTVYNNYLQDQQPDYQRNNSWEQGARPANTLGNTGKEPSAMMVDLFPMRDGKHPASYDGYSKLEASSIAYDPKYPFMNRDPRFYRTFAFPGVRWPFDGDPNTTTGANVFPYKGNEYILWNYVWYNSPEKYNDPTSSNSDRWGADGLMDKVHGLYMRKFSDDRTEKTNYIFSTSGKEIGFRRNNTSTFEIRFAEFLLNYAEAACMSGSMADAVTQLQAIRERAGYTAAENYGLQSNLSSDQNTCMAAILYERQIELAYEGKRAEDMRRWLLYDGGVDFASIGATTLTGWGGNTLTWLGFKSLVGQRRERMEFRLRDDLNYTDGTSGMTWKPADEDKYDPALRDKTNPDPIIQKGLLTRAERDAYAIDLTKDVAEQQDKLKEFYETYLVRKMKKGDGYDSNNNALTMTWKPRYYFYGLTSNNQDSNPTLLQTVGWKDIMNGNANGTFDPLAE